ncbi:hypothetical protein ACO02O_03710 [Dirofilaria immitis]
MYFRYKTADLIQLKLIKQYANAVHVLIRRNE